MAERSDRKWKRNMPTDQIIGLMTDAEVADNARRGGPACIVEHRRRTAANKVTAAQELQRGTGLFSTTAELLRSRRPEGMIS